MARKADARTGQKGRGVHPQGTETQPLKTGDFVIHETLGYGVVVDAAKRKALVAFGADGSDQRAFVLPLCLEKGVIRKTSKAAWEKAQEDAPFSGAKALECLVSFLEEVNGDYDSLSLAMEDFLEEHPGKLSEESTLFNLGCADGSTVSILPSMFSSDIDIQVKDPAGKAVTSRKISWTGK